MRRIFGHNRSRSQSFNSTWLHVDIFQVFFTKLCKIYSPNPSKTIGNFRGVLNSNRLFLKLHRLNQPIHSFLVGCQNPCLQGTNAQVGSPQPYVTNLAASSPHSLGWMRRTLVCNNSLSPHEGYTVTGRTNPDFHPTLIHPDTVSSSDLDSHRESKAPFKHEWPVNYLPGINGYD